MNTNEHVKVLRQKIVSWARPVYARPVSTLDTNKLDELVDIEFHNHPEKPEGEGWHPLVFAGTGDGTAALPQIEALRVEMDALRKALAELIHWIPSADIYRRLGFDPKGPTQAFEEAKKLLLKGENTDGRTGGPRGRQRLPHPDAN